MAPRVSRWSVWLLLSLAPGAAVASVAHPAADPLAHLTADALAHLTADALFHLTADPASAQAADDAATVPSGRHDPRQDPRATPIWIGFHLGLALPSDRESAGIHANSVESIDRALQYDEGLIAAISDRLGGGFTVGRVPRRWRVDPAAVIGIEGAYTIQRRLEISLSFASYKSTATEDLPFVAETEGGLVTRSAELRTDFTAIDADLAARGFLAAGRTTPFVGAGLHLSRVSPRATAVDIAGVGFAVTGEDPVVDVGAMVEVGLRHRLGEHTAIHGRLTACGRTLDEAEGSRFVIEPAIRLGLAFQLSESERTGPHPARGGTQPLASDEFAGEEEQEPPPEDVPPPPPPPEEPPPEREDCVVSDEIVPWTPIRAELVHPVEEDVPWSYSPFDSYPLVVEASDLDRLIQTCRCVGEEGEATGRHPITDPIRYEWVKEEGDGSLHYLGGPAALYYLPDLEVGEADQATFLCTVRDSRSNDDPQICRLSISVKRKAECSYDRSVAVVDSFPRFDMLETVKPGKARCEPAPPVWTPDPDFRKLLDLPEQICVREQRIFRAYSPDGDQDGLALECRGDCGRAGQTRSLPDEHVYKWTAVRGAFAGPRGRIYESIVTNSRTSSVVYEAPEEAGLDTILVEFRDSGIQASDPPQTFTRVIRIAKVDIEIVDDGVYRGGVSEVYEACDGGTIAVNNDDDNENKKQDLDDRRVRDEDDLMEIELSAKEVQGPVTFDILHGEKNVRVWEKSTKDRRVNTPKDYPVSALPKRLFVEGISPSGVKRSAVLTLRGGPGCADEAAATVIPWCADADPSCDWTIHTISWEGGEEEGIIEGVGKEMADAQAGWIADCESRSAAGFGRCMRKFFDQNPQCCCIMNLVLVGHGPDCPKDPEHCKGCGSATPSGLGGGVDEWTNDEFELWASFLCDSGKIEYRKCNGYYEDFFWEFASRLGAGREVKAYTETVTPLTPGLSDSKTFRVPKDAGRGSGPALRRLIDCLTDPSKSEEEKEECRRAWGERR